MSPRRQISSILAELERVKNENKRLKVQLNNEKKISRKYKQLREQFDLIIDTTGFGVWDYNIKTKKVIVNDKWYTNLGYSVEELNENPEHFFHLIHPSDLKKVRNAQKKHIEGEIPLFKVEHRIKTKSGKWKWILNSGKIIERDKNKQGTRIIGTHYDITAVKDYQSKLKKRQQLYKSLFEYAPIGLWEQDISELLEYIKTLKKRKIKNFNEFFDNNPNEVFKCINKIEPKRINKAALDIHDAESITELKKNFANIFTEKSISVFKEQLISLANGDDYFESETETKTLKGKLRKLKIYLSFKPLPVKNQKLILFSLIDITEQKESEIALIESENRYRSLFKISPTGILIENPDGKIIDANPAIHENFGYKNNELIGKNVRSLAHPSMQKNISQNIQSILGGVTLKHIVQGIKADGTTIFNELYETKLSLPSIGDAVLCLSNDITQQINIENQLKRNERQYRFLFYENPLPMYIFELNTLSFLEINKAAIKKYGYSNSELNTMSIIDLYPKGERESAILDIKKLGNGVAERGIWRNKLKNGDIIFVEITASVIDYFNKDAVLVLAHDITERIKIEDKLEKNQEQLRKFAGHLENVREEERTNIAREIHDNLGQVLTAIKLDLSWIASNDKTQNDKFLSKIDSAKRLVNESIQTVQKISTSLRPQIIDDLGLKASLEWLVEDFRNRTDIEYNLALDKSDLIFNNDLEVNIFRIIQEALNNIIRHAEATQVDIDLIQTEKRLEIKIEDNGIGITKEQQNKNNSFGIMGINERVIKYDGYLNIVGKKNKGTKIKIKFPLK